MAATWATGPARWLWITPEIADELSTGALKYSFGLVEAVAAAGIDVTVVGVVRNGRGGRPGAGDASASIRLDAVDGSFRRPWQSLGSRLPNQAFACAVPAVRARVEQLLRQGGWDVVVVDGLQAAWVTSVLERHRGTHCVVYLAHNHEASMRREVADAVPWRNPRRGVLELEAVKTDRLERRTARLADTVSSITDADRHRFEVTAPQATHVVVPPGWNGTVPTAPIPAGQRPRRVGILGSFEWHVKQEGLRRFVAVADGVFHDAGIELVVAGNIPDHFRAELEPGLRATRLVGWVEDAGEFLGHCRIGVISEPLGGGFKLKALDYVFNSVTLACLADNAAGLPLVDGESVVTAADESELARSIVAVVDDDARLDRFARVALERCDEQFSWERVARRLVEAATSTASR